MFSVYGTLLPLILWKLRGSRVRVVLAPRGMLKPSALNHRRWKKKIAITLLRHLRLTEAVVFHATSEDELQEVQSTFPGCAAQIVPNVPVTPASSDSWGVKKTGELQLAFVGRIHPIKNLHLLLEVLSRVSCRTHLRIIGPEEDAAYRTHCRQLIQALPPHVTVAFLGSLPEHEVIRHLQTVDAMALLTAGENFGHAIFESFAAGTPVLISDQTVWRGLSGRFAGWDLPLSDLSGFVHVLDSLGVMSSEEHCRWRHGARSFAEQFLHDANFCVRYAQLFWPSEATLLENEQ